MSMAQRRPEGSALEFDISKRHSFEWTFKIPRGKKLIENLAIAPVSQYDFTGLKFTSGFLKKFKHDWDLIIYAENMLTINLNIEKHPDFGFFLHDSSCKLQVFSQGEHKKTTKLCLNKCESTAQCQVIKWSSDEFCWDDWDDEQARPNNTFYPDFWDNSGDTLKVIFDIQCESVGKCVNLSLLDEDLETLELEGSSETDVTKENYFLSKALSDVTLVSQGEKFPAHQIILSCSSPVFECMFQHKMKETLEGIVSIEDIEPEVVKEMLYFIYTGGVRSSTLENGNLCIGLFKTAEKYEIKGLKMKCANSIVQTIDLENALEMYILGDMYNEPRFTRRAVKLFKQDKWKALRDPIKLKGLTNRCPNLVIELLTAANYD